MDVHIPIRVTEGLRRRGLDVLTSQEDGTATLVDDALLARASELGRLLLTQDQDFLRIATQWQREGRTFAGILFAAQRGTSLGRLVEDVHLAAACCDPEEVRDHVTYLPL